MGFTGTQLGMTAEQEDALREVLLQEQPDEVHHGDCVGSDAQLDRIAREFGAAVVIHPPSNPSKRAHCARPGDVVWEPLPYLDRDLDIVESSTVLVATPRDEREEVRSGTWYTVRVARRMGRRVVVIRPDGSLVREN